MESTTWIDLSSTITVVVAKTGTEYIVHKHVACEKSPFFTACLKEHTKEAREQKIEIQEWDDDDSMRTLIVWMYQGRSVLRISSSLLKYPTTTKGDERADALQMRLTKLYLLADRLLIQELRNNIVDCFGAIYQSHELDAMAVSVLFDNGPSDCLLRSYLLLLITLDMKMIIDGPQELSATQLQSQTELAKLPVVAHAVLQKLLVGVAETPYLCDYHEHGADGEAEKCKGTSDWVNLEDDNATGNEATDEKSDTSA